MGSFFGYSEISILNPQIRYFHKYVNFHFLKNSEASIPGGGPKKSKNRLFENSLGVYPDVRAVSEEQCGCCFAPKKV